ncbi:hypothetical protein PHMEG_00011711 [Phytophthora megakarya]|uniref:MULE transposase domain-containing protein n=1 Tax=Phytophthora megakarya TaxID=4795 RepID=A0A225WB29_9STRA|nr:hypothetical protein PHMEG_00011711 [Phytophthora megakarya]
MVWEKVNTQFYHGLQGRVVQGLTRDQVLSRVHGVHRVQFEGNILGVVEVPGLSLVTDTQLNISISTMFSSKEIIYNELLDVHTLHYWSYCGTQVFKFSLMKQFVRCQDHFTNLSTTRQINNFNLVDVGQALIDSVHRQFQETRIVGCLFHWKQALRRRLGRLRIPQNEIRTSRFAWYCVGGKIDESTLPSAQHSLLFYKVELILNLLSLNLIGIFPPEV